MKSRLKEEQYPFLNDINQPTKKYKMFLYYKILVICIKLIYNLGLDLYNLFSLSLLSQQTKTHCVYISLLVNVPNDKRRCQHSVYIVNIIFMTLCVCILCELCHRIGCNIFIIILYTLQKSLTTASTHQLWRLSIHSRNWRVYLN